MRQMTKKNKIAAAAASVALVAVGGGAAYAYWSTTGGGYGTATAGSDNAVVIHAAFDDGITPGVNGAKTIKYTADNPNTSSTPVTLNTATTVSTSAADCKGSWFTATVPTATTTVAGNAVGAALTGTGTLTLNDDPAVDQNACKGATITVTVTSH
ncbi:hypothetical protein QFZ36_001534 [Pseudarthrobacter siccitolerans]|uniref:Ribosomally synthesized peptide with SipW-like signal peptide n=1 Tax=Pseudarthrobacter siccitolerans TaxID=861266 RepID=A0ABU0PJ31_9MICC|nr:hypothetical protein [Pseudarthrobacter siccitolerans]MDQ0673973.1 hypothetical protein [Pseudarthrobacter siccitolerans]